MLLRKKRRQWKRDSKAWRMRQKEAAAALPMSSTQSHDPAEDQQAGPSRNTSVGQGGGGQNHKSRGAPFQLLGKMQKKEFLAG